MSFVEGGLRVLVVALPAALAQLVLAVGVVAVAWGVGRGTLGVWAAGRPEVDADDPELAPVWAGVGFAVLGMAGFVLGMVGWLEVVGMGVVAAGAGGVGVASVVTRLRSATAGTGTGRFGLRDVVALGFGALALLPVALLGVYPPHHVDDLTYHLPFVEAFADTGRMPFLPELLYPVFPQLAEVLWVPLYEIFGPRGATATNLAHGLLVLWVLWVWGRHLGQRLGDAGLGVATGLWTMAAWLGILELAATGATAHVDVTLTSFVAVAAWAVGRSRTEPGSAVWVVAAGLAAGAAVATKLHGLLLAPLLALPFVWDLVRRRSDRLTSARRLAVYALVALAFAAPWTGRIASLTGSPVFPFYPPPFESPEDLQPFVRAKTDNLGATPAPLLQRVVRDLPDIPRLALELTVTGRRSDGRPPFSPWLLLLVPLAVPALLRRGSGRWVVAPIVCYLAVWFVTYRDPRYLMPAVAVVLPFALAAAGRAVPRWLLERRAAVAAVALVLALPGLAYGLYRLDALGPLPTTPPERDRFLETRIEGYGLLDDLERHRPESSEGAVYVLGHPRLRYFVPGRALGERRSVYRHRLVLDRLGQPDELADLLAEWGVTHLLVTRRFPRPEPSPRLELLHDGPSGAIYHVRAARNAPPPDP